MVGVGYRACSAFHLAEYRYCERPPRRVYSCVVKKRGKPRWFEYRDVVLDDRDFETIGNYLESELKDRGAMLTGRVGRAASSVDPHAPRRRPCRPMDGREPCVEATGASKKGLVAQSKPVAASSNIGFCLIYLYLYPMSATLPRDWKAAACTHLGETPVTGRSSS